MDWDNFKAWSETPAGQQYLKNPRALINPGVKAALKTRRTTTPKTRYPEDRTKPVGIFKSASEDDEQPEREETKDWLKLPVVPFDPKPLERWFVLAIALDAGEEDRLVTMLHELSDARKARLAKLATAR